MELRAQKSVSRMPDFSRYPSRERTSVAGCLICATSRRILHASRFCCTSFASLLIARFFDSSRPARILLPRHGVYVWARVLHFSFCSFRPVAISLDRGMKYFRNFFSTVRRFHAFYLAVLCPARKKDPVAPKRFYDVLYGGAEFTKDIHMDACVARRMPRPKWL